MTAADPRPAVATAVVAVGAGALLALDRAGAVEAGWGWGLPLACVIAGLALLAVAPPSHRAAYAGTLTRLAPPGATLWVLRAATVLTAPVAGLGVAAYAATALYQALEAPLVAAPAIDWRRSCGTGLLGLAVVLALTEMGYQVGDDTVLWTVLLAGSGLSLFWWFPDRRPARVHGGAWNDSTVLSYLGLGLAGTAILYVLGSTGLFEQADDTIVGATVALVVLALVVGPRWLRTSRALAVERVERARATERAELGGMLHDSVLQTLALIQTRADDPSEVAALARRQERDLRAWLLGRPIATGPPRSIATALRGVAAEVEDAHKVKIDVVMVGDAPLDEHLEPLVAAAREALVNAAKHAPDSPISLFGEIEERRVAAYVRDRGPGFDLDTIPADRHGVRDSIIARMVRHGGHAAVRMAPGGGCEVRLVQERRA